MNETKDGPWEIETRLLDAIFEQVDKMLESEPDADFNDLVIACIGAAVDWQSSKHIKMCELIMDLCLELEKRK